MSNIIPTNIQIPAHLQRVMGQPSALSQSVAGGISGGANYPRISIKGARFRIVEGNAETVLEDLKLETVIVGANPRLSKTYYASQWAPDSEPSSPDCQSLDGIRPSSDVAEPQSDLCATCPMNAWGSKVTPTGQQIKACADQKRLAVVAANDLSGPIYQLLVTPAALKGLGAYQKELSMRGIPVEVCKTVVTFDTDASFPKLVFKFGGFLSEAEYAEVEQIIGTDPVLEITGEKEISQPVAAQPEVRNDPPPATKPKAAPKPKAVAAAPAPEPEAPPAEPKRGFGGKPAAEAAPAPKPAAPKPAAPKPTAAEAPAALADEIAALMQEMEDDD